MSTSISSRAGGACSFDMSEGLTVDGWLAEVLFDALFELFEPPHPAVMSAAAVMITRVLDVVTVNHLGPRRPNSHVEGPRLCGGRAPPHRSPRPRQLSPVRTPVSRAATRGGPVSRRAVVRSRLRRRLKLGLAARGLAAVDSPCAPTESTQHDERAEQHSQAADGPQHRRGLGV